VATRRGPVERAVRRDVRALGDLGGVQRSLAETAFNLARTLDEGAGMAAAAVARELRATLETLERRVDSDSGTGFVAGLLAAVDDPEDGSAHAGRGARAVRGSVGDAADAVAEARRRRRA
jgi:hypothetical protein